jgi:hypothetical protein
VDLEYYIAKQFHNPTQKLLVYHPQLFDFDTLYNKYLTKIQLAAQHLSDINDTIPKRRLTLQDIQEEAAAKRSLTNTKQTKKIKPPEIEDEDFAI